MHAIRVGETGGPEVLAWEETTAPEPGPGQLRVSVVAAGVNYIDTYHRRGIYPLGLPFTPGLEGSGVVEQLGQGVTGFAPGDRVAWTDQLGSYADHTVVAAARAVPVPEGTPLMTAAATMLQGITAHYLATDTFRLRAGQRCLIHATGADPMAERLRLCDHDPSRKVLEAVAEMSGWTGPNPAENVGRGVA